MTLRPPVAGLLTNRPADDTLNMRILHISQTDPLPHSVCKRQETRNLTQSHHDNERDLEIAVNFARDRIRVTVTSTTVACSKEQGQKISVVQVESKDIKRKHKAHRPQNLARCSALTRTQTLSLARKRPGIEEGTGKSLPDANFVQSWPLLKGTAPVQQCACAGPS